MVGDCYGRVRARIEGTEGDGNPTGRPTESINLTLWELPETEPLTKEHTWTGPRSPPYVVEVQLGRHAGPPTTGARAV